ncbi:MAG TPA: S-layer homology domain-containing protein [Negativicutes bacterium]
MKKSLIITLALVFVLSIAGTAFAASNPFVDVPAKHWSYAAVSQLAQAGIVDGYGDGTFRGDKTMTRYEMAQIVAKAMARSDKADAAQKAIIDKLSVEFASELEGLNVRVTKLEDKVGNVKFTGEVRARYEWTKEPLDTSNSPAEITRLRLGMFAPLTDDISFNGRLSSENNDYGDNSVELDQAYLNAKVLGGADLTLGRQPLYLGQGILMDTDSGFDGVTLAFGNKLKVLAGAAKYNADYDLPDNLNLPHANLTYYNVGYDINSKLNISASYLKDKDNALYKSTAAGLAYTFSDKFAVSGEYGKNDSAVAKQANGNDAAKAWIGKVKYRGADGLKDHSYGIWVGYRKADANFDPVTFDTLDGADAAGGYLDNVKGLEYGVEYTVFQNGILSLQYNDLKENKFQNGDDTKKNFLASLTYTF